MKKKKENKKGKISKQKNLKTKKKKYVNIYLFNINKSGMR